MARLNLTLDEETWRRLDECARRSGERRASLARRLLKEALGRRDVLERRKKVARDFAAAGSHDVDLLRALEEGQLDLLDDD